MVYNITNKGFEFRKNMGFKSYCWHIGNTSFRVKQLAYKNEIQLSALLELEKRFPDFEWNNEIQTKYYNLLATDDYGLTTGTATKKDKDAREKTAPLLDLGLITDNRRLTEVGRRIHQISVEHDFESDNVLERSKDSYLYLLQLLKMQVVDDDIKIKPFLAFLYLLIKCDYLSKDEFTYLMPLCKNTGDVVSLAAKINTTSHNIDIDNYILERILLMDNYKEALSLLLASDGDVSEDLIVKVGLNRKSGQNGEVKYDAPIAHVLNECLYISLNKDSLSHEEKIEHLKSLKKKVDKVSSNQKGAWNKYFMFGRKKNYSNSDLDDFYALDMFGFTDEKDLKKYFFKTWHLNKIKNTLENYYDLNKRYFMLSDMFLYSNERFKLIDLGFFYFSDIIDEMLFRNLLEPDAYRISFSSIIPIEQIDPVCIKTNKDIADVINERFGERILPNQVEQYVKEINNKAFIKFVDENFGNDVIIHLLDCFKERNDEEILALVSDEAMPSTSFEYIVAIIWYRLSGEKGYLEDYMNLSLSNYRPKSHAPGGKPDILFKYKLNEKYPTHDLVIEVTLSESTTQIEMEQLTVKRHLETNIKETHNTNDYAIFIAGNLDERIIQGFRAFKHYHFSDGGIERSGLNIVPLDTDILKHLILNDVGYEKIFKVCLESYKSANDSLSWYQEELKNKILMLN